LPPASRKRGAATGLEEERASQKRHTSKT
jgi:hypothetical protein